MSTPNVPPRIARQIAAMGKAGPARAGVPPATPPPPPQRPGRAMMKFALAGWLLAIGASAVAYLVYARADAARRAALDEQAAVYDARIQQTQAEAAAAIQKAQDDAAAQLQILQTELDFQKMPELPLKTVFRPGGVLYVESELEEPFDCKVRMSRPGSPATLEVDFRMKARSFQDLGAIQNWVFARGDRVEFLKAGYKPRALTVP